MNVVENVLGKKYKKNDWDFDGIKNKKDCQPRNPMRQDEIVNTGGTKKFIYPSGMKFLDTESTKQFKESYNNWQQKKNKKGFISNRFKRK